MSCCCKNNVVTNIIVAGLGGQGVLKVTDILAEAIFESGYDVKKSEVHGMSQRGGSVSSEVRFGCKVASPMVPEGECDFLAVIEPSRIEAELVNLRELGTLITPDDVPVDQLKHPKALNVMVLGALAAHLGPVVEKAVWEKCVAAAFPEKLRELNLEMFAIGYESVKR